MSFLYSNQAYTRRGNGDLEIIIRFNMIKDLETILLKDINQYRQMSNIYLKSINQPQKILLVRQMLSIVLRKA